MVRYASRLQALAARTAAIPPQPKPTPTTKVRPNHKPTRSGLSWKEQQELAGLPEHLEALEAQRDELGTQLADPRTYQGPGDQAARLTEAFNELEREIATGYARWEDLESRS